MPERGEDPLADKIDDLLKGKGTVGKMLKNFGLTGGSDDEKSDRDRGTRRHRR